MSLSPRTNTDINELFESEDIQWNNKKQFPHDYIETFTNILSHCSITGRSKFIIRERYINLYNRYYQKYKKTKLYYTFSRIFVGVGGIIVPALVTLDNAISEKSDLSVKIGYVTFSISLSIFVVNMLYEIQSISRKYYTYSSVNEKMISEGWMFLSLTGYYKKYLSHKECWRKFIERIEKINTEAVSTNLIITQDESNQKLNTLVAPNNINIGGFELNELSNDLNKNNEKTIIYTNH